MTAQPTAKEKGKNLIDKALGDIVSPIMNVVDVDGVVRRIDVNDIAQRIDINELVQRIDINTLLQKVDINAIIDRSDLAAIVAQSSSGVFDGIVDTLRFQIVRVDLFLLHIFQFGKDVLPPAPGMVDQQTPFPTGTLQKAVAVQLHYCGLFSKALAIGIDTILLFLTQALFTLFTQSALKRINELFLHWLHNQETIDQDEFIFASVLNALSSFCYFWITIALTGQTIGMAIVGVRVVNTNGDKDVSVSRAFLRTAVLVVTVMTWPLSILVGIHRRDGRMPHDLVASLGVIFKWNARMAKLREKSILDSNSITDSTNEQEGSDTNTLSEDGNQSSPPDGQESSGEDHKDADNGATTQPVEAKSDDIANKNTENRLVVSSNRRKSVPVAQQNVGGATSTVPRTITLSTEDEAQNAALAVSNPRESKLKKVLNDGRKDLQNAKPQGVVGFFFKPVRTLVLEPSLAVAAAVAPPVVSAVPFADEITALGVGIPFEAARIGYGFLYSRDEPPQEEASPSLVEENAILLLKGDVSATPSVTPKLPEMESYEYLLSASQSLGIRTDGMNDASHFGGRLLDDLRILNNIQEQSLTRQNIKRYPQTEVQDAINQGSTMMNYAVAAYGTALVQCGGGSDGVRKLDTTAKSIAAFVGVDEDDIKIICVNGAGSSMKLLRHFVALDEKSNSVVLAIGGDFCASYCSVIDAAGANTVEFCGGTAPKDLSQVANNIWSVSGDIITKLFSQLESGGDSREWSLAITGHGIGAGVATLLNIKCHVEGLLGDRQVTCFGFGSPPVFSFDNENVTDSTAAIRNAVANSICYINGDDCIPFLSQVSFARFESQVKTVDDACQPLWIRDRDGLGSGRLPIPQVLIHKVTTTDPVEMTQSVRLMIPAGKIVWIQSFGGELNAFGCNADDLAKLDIFASSDMVADHLPSAYLGILDALAVRESKEDDE